MVKSKITLSQKTWFGVDQETTYGLRFFSEFLDKGQLAL